jgi:hypothetical protein
LRIISIPPRIESGPVGASEDDRMVGHDAGGDQLVDELEVTLVEPLLVGAADELAIISSRRGWL